MKFALGALAAVVLAASPAMAGAGITKSQIAQALSSEGYSVQDFQPNSLAVTVGGQVILVGLDGADADVTYRTYLSGVSIDSVGHDFLNKFNSDVKFGRAYVDADGDIAIQMDRNSAGGVSIANIKSDFDVFLLLVSKFMSDMERRVSA